MTVSYPLFTCTLESSGHNKNETVTTKQAAPREGLQKQPSHGTWPDTQCDPKPGKRRPHTAELRPADVTSGTSDSQTHAQGGDPRGKARALPTAQGSSSGTVDGPPHTGTLRRPRITTWTLSTSCSCGRSTPHPCVGAALRKVQDGARVCDGE